MQKKTNTRKSYDAVPLMKKNLVFKIVKAGGLSRYKRGRCNQRSRIVGAIKQKRLEINRLVEGQM